MTSRIFLTLLLSTAVCSAALSQSPTIDIIGSGTGMVGYAGFYNPKHLINKARTLDYKDIEGTCFWDNKWNPAFLVGSQGKKIKLEKIKLNSYSNEIHFVDPSSEEFVLQKGIVRKIIFLDPKDTSKVTTIFQNFGTGTKDDFFQVLNEGKVQGLKKMSTTVKRIGYNQYQNKDVYRFSTEKKYLLSQDNLQAEIKLNKASILSNLHSDNVPSEEWLEANKNKLKSENDLIAFLNYFNSKVK
jgi:hypothetical protein